MLKKVLLAVVIGVICSISIGYIAVYRLIKDDLDTAFSEVQALYSEVTEGKIPEDLAKEISLRQISSERFEESGYMFVMNSNYVVLASGEKPGIVGKDIKDLRASDDRYIFQEMMEEYRENGYGMVNCTWYKVGEREAGS